MRYLFLAFALIFVSPVYAQDASPPEAVEAAADAPEEAAPEADAPEEAAPEDAAPDAPEEAEGSEDEIKDAAPVPAEPSTPSADQIDATAESVSLLVDALQSKNWALAFGILLSILVAFANKFGLKDKVGGQAVPWVTAGVAVLGAVGAALVAGVSVVEAVSQGLVAGVAAIGGWEMLLKHLLAVPKGEAASE